MDVKDVIDEIKLACLNAKDNKQETISILRLEAFLQKIQDDSERSSELRALDYQARIAYTTAKNNLAVAKFNIRGLSNAEMFKSVIDAGKDGLKSVLLINGGAVIALLGLIGAKAEEIKSIIPQLSVSLLYFGVGVALGALGFGLRYLSQFCYGLGKKKTNRYGDILLVLTVTIALVGFGMFCFALWLTYKIFSGM